MKIRFSLIVLAGYASLAAAAYKPSSLFVQRCAKCHGEDGKAGTPKGQKMKAQDLTDSAFQEKVSDAQMIDAVTNGTEKDMPPFGKVLSAEEIDRLVKEDVRGFGKK